MKNRTWLAVVLSLVLATTLWSCGPSYVGVRTGPAWGPGYYGPGPYYGYRPRVYAVPPRAFYGRPYYAPPRYHYRFNNPRAYGRGFGYGRRGRW